MKRSLTILPVAISALGLLLGACGDGPDPVPTPTPTQAPTTAPTQAPIGLKRADVEGHADVQETPSGVKYVDLEVGTGASPEPAQEVEIHYTGTVAESGVQFDSSRDRGQTLELPANAFIPGFNEALSTMKVGGHRLMLIPAELAYADRPPAGIPVNADLVFDVELVSIK